MQVDFIKNPEATGRYQVIDLESGEDIEGVWIVDLFLEPVPADAQCLPRAR